MDLKYLNLLAREYPTIQSVATEIVNLSAICCLPKGTEHFMSDLHGEHDAFLHLMNNCSGVIREKIDVAFSASLTIAEKNELAALIYYPERMIERMRATDIDISDWYKVVLMRMVEVCHAVTHKYTRSKVRKALPPDFAYIIDELLHAHYSDADRANYYQNIIASIIDLNRAEAFIIALADLIKCMAVDRLHIVGDIFDRGPHADVILDRLMKQHSVDIEWGNHDVLWMGAAAGSDVCIATVIKNCIQYDNLDMLENSYGISLLPLAVFASEHYKGMDASAFIPRVESNRGYKPKDGELYARMHKAICVIMFKLEGQLIARNPDFNMADRDMLRRVNFDTGEIEIDGKVHKLRDADFPTVLPSDPLSLSESERILMEELERAFLNSEKLQTHIRYLYSVGSLYNVCNDNLLYHGCVPTNADGSFMEFTYDGVNYSGKRLFDYADRMARMAFYSPYDSKEGLRGRDYMWYLWCGRNSPVFGRDHIATFERALIDDESTWAEPKNPYYTCYNNEDFCTRVLQEFGVTAQFSHIVNGHIPVKAKSGEDPRRANGRLIVIDGGFCKAYQKTTGIAGYTMFFDSHGLRISAHEPFDMSKVTDILNTDIRSRRVIVDNAPNRILVRETDIGRELTERIDVLKMLLEAYQNGDLKERG